MTPTEVTNFVGGLITDSNPMSYPPNASLDEYNMLINQDGTRGRRPGMALEDDYTYIEATIDNDSSIENISYRTFKWSNVAGIPNLTYIVVQIGNYLGVHNSESGSVSEDGAVFTYDLGSVSSFCTMASVDGLLVIATGGQEIVSISFDSVTNSFEVNPYRLLIRDTFGVEDILDGINYREGSNIAKRPRTLTGEHSYNLRNQTFAMPRLIGGIAQETIQDPISAWKAYSVSNFPSNADSILDAFYPNSASELDPTTNRFNPKELGSNPPGTFSAPIGYFIIDALDRGTSRIVETNKLYEDKNRLQDNYKTLSLPIDSTPTGPNCVAQFAGRIFYAGFTSEVIDGDSHSPRMGSYVLFSKLVENYKDLKICYQLGDPTSKDYSELLDTDGGFFRLEGAYNIQAMVPLTTGLAVLAENGVWLLQGEDRGQFKATSFSTSKLSPNGCDSPCSVVITGDGFMFWSRDGIYQVAPNQFGDLEVSNITKGKIQRFYDAISAEDRKFVVGTLDKYERKAKWVYGNRLNVDTVCRELVYSFDFEAFTVNKIGRTVLASGDTSNEVVIAAPVVMPAFSAVRTDVGVFVDSDLVLVNDEPVAVSEYETTNSLTETKYLTIIDWGFNFVEYSFSSYSEPFHYDWPTATTPIDAESVILTGWVGGGDYQRNKQVPFLTMHFYKTEKGFEEIDPEDPLTDWESLDQSSCLLQTQWSWSNHVNSGKWGTPFQTYRFSRFWQPTLLTDGFDNGFYTVETRNKLRGSGKVLSMKFTSEPGKHMNIIGWSMMLQGRAGV